MACFKPYCRVLSVNHRPFADRVDQNHTVEKLPPDRGSTISRQGNFFSLKHKFEITISDSLLWIVKASFKSITSIRVQTLRTLLCETWA